MTAPTAQGRVVCVGDNVMVTEVAFGEGARGGHQGHAHPNEQIVIVLEGRIELTAGAHTHTLMAGDAAHVPAGVEHGIVALMPSRIINVFSPLRQDLIARRATMERDLKEP